MTTAARRPFWRSPTIRRHAGATAVLALFLAVWAALGAADGPVASIFAGALSMVAVGVVGAGIILAVGLVFGGAFDRQAERRRAAAKAFADARPDPRNRTGPSITIWPEDEAGRVVAFIEYPDGTVDDVAISYGTAQFGAIIELLYRLADDQVGVVVQVLTDNGRPDMSTAAFIAAIRFPPSWGTDGLVRLPPVPIADRRAAIAAREAAFRASIGSGPPVASD